MDDKLRSVMKNEAVWKDYYTLFDNRVSEDNIQVEYLRSLVVGAGPIQEGDTRYDNLKDSTKEQEKVLTRFQKKLRSLANSGE